LGLSSLQKWAVLVEEINKLMAEVEAQARTILEALLKADFLDCVPITREFAELTTRPGIYAVRHRIEGLLYVGKAQDIKERFRGGHKSITWSWLADYNHRDVAIATYTLDFMQWRALSSELERIILNLSEPPFNARIPMRD
jgi:hypothetical protein